MAVAYVDASAVVKLVRAEAESAALAQYLAHCEVVTCELAVAETMRALQRYAALHDPTVDAETVERLAIDVIQDVHLVVLNLQICLRAGRLSGLIRALDAVHIASAQELGIVDVFVTYDERQAAAARLAGLRTVSPGA